MSVESEHLRVDQRLWQWRNTKFGPVVFALPLILVGALGLDLARDTFAPLSLDSRLQGITYGLAGLTSLAGALLLVLLPGSFVKDRSTWTTVLWLTAGALTYICLTLAVYSFALERWRAVGELALLVLSLISFTGLATRSAVTGRRQSAVPPANLWSNSQPSPDTGLGRIRLSAAAAAAVLTAAQFWYSNVYLPANAEVGISFSVAAGPPFAASRQLRLVPIRITFRNESSVSALALGSMFVINGVIFHSGAPQWSTSEHIAAIAPQIGLGHDTAPQDNIVALGPHYATTERLLAIGHLLADGRTLFPNVTQSTRVVVAVPPGVTAFEVHAELSYTRNTQLQLADQNYTMGQVRHPVASYVSRACVPRPQRSAMAATPVNLIEIRQLDESVLESLSRGPEVLVTYWCYELQKEATFSFVARRPANLQPTAKWTTPPAPASVVALDPGTANRYGIRHVQGIWTIPIP